MTNPRGQSAIDARRKWRAAHPEARTSGGTKEQKKARREQIKAISPAIQTFVVQLAGTGTYLPTARAIAGRLTGNGAVAH